MLIVLLTAIFMSLLGVSVVNVAVPAIQHGLGASRSDIQWVLSGYALTFGVVLVAAGRAGDILGRGWIFLLGVAVFTVASVGAGLAPDAKWLNAARLAQGIGSGLLNPQGLGMIQQYFQGAERARAFGFFGTTVGFSVAVGPVVGGLLIKLGGPEIGWRLTFLVNVPIGILAILLALLWFPRPMRRRSEQRDGGASAGLLGTVRALDPVGAVLLCLAVLSLLFPFVESRGGSAWLWLLLPLSILLTAAWIKWERRHARLGLKPMVDLRIFHTPSFANGTVIMTLYFLGMTSVWVLVALYVQEGNGKDAFQSSMFGVPSALLSAYAADWAGRRIMGYGRIVVVGGLLLALTGLLLSCLVIHLAGAGHLSIWWLMLSLSFVGLGQGATISPNQALTLAEVPLEYAGSSSAVMQTGQRIGASVGIALITAAVFALLPRTDWTRAVLAGFVLIILAVVVALGFALKDLRQRRALGLR